jgi:phospholipase/carboxylesterase
MPPIYGDARAWWMLDLERIEREVSADRAAEVPEGLAAARTAVVDFLEALARDHRRRDEATVLGGFSQGAMLTVDVALRGTCEPRGLILLSGTMIAEDQWRPLARELAGRPVLQTHGTRDALLSFAGAEKLRDFLMGGGAQVAFVPFPGGHEIPPPVLELAGEFLEQVFAAP